MPGSEDAIQRAVHALEAGGMAIWLRRALLLLAVLAVAVFYLMREVRGLATSQAMDQAQIGREIAMGHGWRTKFIRPRAIGQLQNRGKDVAQKIWYDTYNAPLPPLVDAITLFPIRSQLKMTPRDTTYIGDRAIALGGVVLFVGSLVIFFLVARRLFDQRLALLSGSLVLVCDMIWQYSLSGLPQMLLLLLFNATLYFLVRAVEAQYGGGRVGLWLALAGVGFGLLALSHALTIWIFLAAFIFGAFFFRPRLWAVMIVAVAFAIIYFPWLARNFIICGQPGGVAIYSILDGVRHPEAGWMRRIGFSTEGILAGAFRKKVIDNLSSQLSHIFGYLGWSVVAPAFFVSLLHRFRRRETAVMRWLVLSMWLGAVAGMALYGIEEEQDVAANQLHLLFLPIMTCYGLAFLLVLWNRLEIAFSYARVGFLILLFLICGWPMITRTPLFTQAPSPIRWPPYVPPYIAVLNIWMKPDEVTASDIPWAVAWYADRRALWLPENISVVTELSDYRMLGGPINGLYLTPESGSEDKLGDILKGEYQDWAPVILRGINLETFPFKWATLLGLGNECVFFSDHNRLQAIPPE
jgi:4-amino-4-deoxy-L-arabinose transferase-like glycosyltransferase